MSSSVSGLIKLLIGAIGLTPTLVGLLAAGIMIGKAKPCEGAAPCRPVAFGAEVLLIPIGTVVPFVCGYLLFLVPSEAKKQKQLTVSVLPSGATNESISSLPSEVTNESISSLPSGVTTDA